MLTTINNKNETLEMTEAGASVGLLLATALHSRVAGKVMDMNRSRERHVLS